jgi:DNA-binding winged helix-turn-helix (wHTH) protein
VYATESRERMVILRWNFGEDDTHPIIRIAGRREIMMEDLRVGSWVVAPSLNSISSRGKTVRLEPKVMEVLLCLARHPGETLSKEQLFQAVWPKTIVTEDVLKRCIAQLRRAFNDNAREPRTIETISKRGYRLIAPVTAPIVAR